MFLFSWKNLFRHLCVVKCCTSWNTQLRFYFLLGSGWKGMWIAKSGIKSLLYGLTSGHMVFSYRGVLEQEGRARHFFHSCYFLLGDFPGLESVWSVQARGINRCNSPDSVLECFLLCCTSHCKRPGQHRCSFMTDFIVCTRPRAWLKLFCIPHSSLHVSRF